MFIKIKVYDTISSDKLVKYRSINNIPHIIQFNWEKKVLFTRP